MDLTIRNTGLEQLLGIIYGNETSLSTLLGELGFERFQVGQFQNGHREALVE